MSEDIHATDIIDPFLFGALAASCVSRMDNELPWQLNVSYFALALAAIARILAITLGVFKTL